MLQRLALGDSKNHEIACEGDGDRKNNERFIDQEQASAEIDAIVLEFPIDKAEDTDDEDDSDMESLVSPSTEALIDQNAVDVMDMANLPSNKTADCWNWSVFDELSEDEVDGLPRSLKKENIVKLFRTPVKLPKDPEF